MQQQSKRKKIIGRIAVVGLLVLLACTLVSRSVARALTPQVEIAEPGGNSIGFTATADASLVYNARVPLYAEADWTILTLAKQPGDAVTGEDVLFTVDASSFAAQENQLLLALWNAQQAQEQMEQYATAETLESKAYRALRLQAGMAWNDLSAYRKTHPADGQVLSPAAGVLSEWLVEERDFVTQGQQIAWLLGDASKAAVKWSMSRAGGLNYGLGCDVTVRIAAADENDTASFSSRSRVAKREWNAETQMWDFSAFLQEELPAVSEGAQISVRLSRTETLPTASAVPLACVQEDPATGSAFVYCLRSRDGLFGQEFYVVRQDVTLELQNNLYAAVSGLTYGEQLVRYASKPLYDGAVVSVVE